MSQNMCRFCLTENPMYPYSIYNDSIRDAVYDYLGQYVSFEQNDGLPEIICEDCCLRVREAIEFRQKCVENDRELRRRYDEACREVENALGRRTEDVLRELGDEWVSMECFMTGNKDGGEYEAFINDTNLNGSTEMVDFEILEMSMLNKLLLEETTIDMFSDVCGMDGNIIADKDFFDPNTQTNSKLFETLDTPAIGDSFQQIHFEQNANEKSEPCLPSLCSSPGSHYKCPKCEKKFTRNFQLKLHLISIHQIGDGLQYNCSKCDKTFASRHSLNYHTKSLHTRERPFGCPYCSRTFVLRTQLTSHLRVHTGESKPRLHDCTYCGKSWPTKSDLRTHMRIHDPHVERPFKCDSCDKSFFTRGHLSSHLLVHSGKKPHVCVFCKKSYQSVGNLNNHLMKHHSEILLSNRSGNPHKEQSTQTLLATSLVSIGKC